MTMNKKQSKRQRDIKNKLMAAICMLLVSSIMMVSTTYAWFTLSTAPEVTGITTAVGANGNLEMLLQPLDGNTEAVQSTTGDSVVTTGSAYISNTRWGNLVDVSSNDDYGLSNITLYPAELNIADGIINMQNILKTPEYGHDGRVSGLVSKTITGVWDQSNKAFYESITPDATNDNPNPETIKNAKGVRAVGTSSGMTERQLAYRTALGNANAAAQKAQTLASQALNTHGNVLANVAIKHATSDETNETYTAKDVEAMQAIVDALQGTVADEYDGALEQIELALRYYIVANTIRNASDDTYLATQNAIMKATMDDLMDGSITVDGETYTVALPKDTAAGIDVATYIGLLVGTDAADDDDGMYEKVAKADTLLDGKGEGVTWNELSPALTLLADPNAMVVNNIKVSELRNQTGTNDKGEPVYGNMSALVNSVVKEGLNLTLHSGAGIFADIADFTGDYSAGIVLEEITYGGLTVEDLNANMSTKTSRDGKTTTTGEGDDAVTTENGSPYLTEAKTATGDFVATVGGNSSAPLTDFYGYILDLAFRTNVSNSYLQIQTEAVDRIYSDGSNTQTMGHGATMTFTTGSSDFAGEAMKTLMKCIRIVFFDTDTQKVIANARLDTDKATGSTTMTMPLYLVDEDGVRIEDDDDTDHDESIAIMELKQNTIHELSVLVYLDGNAVTNATVANAAKSLTGSMSLQFSSSATLDPMDYSNLKTDSSSNSGDEDDDEAITLTSATTSIEGASVISAAYADGKVVVALSGVEAGTSVKVTVGTEELTTTTVSQNDVVVAIVTPTTTTVTASTTVVVAANS